MLYEWIQQLSFARTWVLPFLGLVPVLAWIQWRNRRALRPAFRVSTAAVFRVRTLRQKLMGLPGLFHWLALACIIVALARPQIKDVQSRNKGEGIAIVLCLDVSGSMLSQDF
ncbi:MAG: aerotolerance regulator BatA, partial [Chitinophagaceae bacterium]